MKVVVESVMVLSLICANVIAQKIEDPPTTNSSSFTSLSIAGNSYPIFLNREEHSSFTINYGISKQALLELQGFYNTYLLTNRVRTSLTGKVYLNDKLHLFSGLDLELEASKYGRPPQPYRLGSLMGAGYDVNDNLMFEAKSNIQLNNSKMGLYGESLIPMNSAFSLGSKIKF